MKDVEKKEFGDQLGVGRGRKKKKNTTNNLKLVFLSIIFIYIFFCWELQEYDFTAWFQWNSQ